MTDYDLLLKNLTDSLDLDAAAQIFSAINDAHRTDDWRQITEIVIAFLRTVPHDTQAGILFNMVKSARVHEREHVKRVVDAVLPHISRDQAILFMKELTLHTIDERDRHRGR